jgi:hypothetical protein
MRSAAEGGGFTDPLQGFPPPLSDTRLQPGYFSET